MCFPIDDWVMAVDTNEPQQVDEVPVEPSVEGGDETTESGHLERMASTPSHRTRVRICPEVAQRHGTSESSCPRPHTSQTSQCRGARRDRQTLLTVAATEDWPIAVVQR